MKSRLASIRGVTGGALIAISATLAAGPLTTPNSFTAGTPARASEINANFSAVATAVNDNNARIATIESRVTTAGNIVLAPSTATAGNILKGTAPFLHNFGTNNTFVGVNAGNLAMTGSDNTVLGAFTLFNNASGIANTAIGAGALQSNISGSGNIAIGQFAGFSNTGSSNITIGNPGVAAESGTIRIGNDSHSAAFIAGVRGTTTASAAIPVLVDSNGQLGTASSSRRAKDDIADMGAASGVLMKLRPVTFHYKSDRDPNGRTLQYGLVAEEVADVAPGLVAHSADGSIETVYYQFLAPMLLNEYQALRRVVDAQAAQAERRAQELADLEQRMARMAALVARLEQSKVAALAAAGSSALRPNDRD